jgi:hypothetical protein
MGFTSGSDKGHSVDQSVFRLYVVRRHGTPLRLEVEDGAVFDGSAHASGGGLGRGPEGRRRRRQMPSEPGVVHRLVQRRRETGTIAPRQPTRSRPQALARQEDRLRALVAERSDRTLVELRAALPTSASLAAIWRALDRLDLTVKQNRTRR